MLKRMLRHIAGRRSNALLFEDKFGGSTVSKKWAKTDSESKLSVSAGNLVCSGGKASPEHGDPALTGIRGYIRSTDLTLEAKLRSGATNTAGPIVGWSNTSPMTDLATQMEGLLYLETNGLCAKFSIAANGAQINTLVAYTANNWRWFRIVCKATGMLYYVSTDGLTWPIVWEDSAGTTALLYPQWHSYSAACDGDYVCIYRSISQPAVIDATAAAPTLAYEAEQASGNLTVGKWYKITASQLDYFYTGSVANDTFRATAATALDANNKVQEITLSSTLSGGGDASSKYSLDDAACTTGARNQDGHLICLDSASSPLYYLQAYIDRIQAKAYLIKVENGTTTDLTSGDVTYGAGKVLRLVIVPGTSGLSNAQVAIYYDGTKEGTTQTVDLTSYGTLVRAFRTNESDTIVITSQIGLGI